jgi:predicted MPP superfamily phosphohydrolase
MSGIILIVAWVGAVLWPLLLAFALWRGLRKGRGPGWLGWLLIVVVTLAWGVGVRAFLWEPETLVVRRVDVVGAMWNGEPLRVGLISDIHSGGAHMSVARLESIVGQMNSEQPDIILLLGDYVGGNPDASQRSAENNAAVMAGLPPLKKLRAPLGVWSVLGNHDWWYDGPGVDKGGFEGNGLIRRGLEAEGIRVLENERVHIERPGGAFWLGGLADYDSRKAQPSYGETLKDLPDGDPVIVMSHWPDAFALAPPRVFITFAGHTHCGQVNLPVFGRLMHASAGSEKWPCGLYNDLGRRLYVTGGVGVSMLPVRFNQPPEIAVVTLRGD